jgi:MYXO-CTERM domain-containing protein
VPPPSVPTPAPAPVVNTSPVVDPPQALPPQPGESEPRQGDLEYGQPQGCGASATGGVPVVAAAALLALALLMRRQRRRVPLPG